MCDIWDGCGLLGGWSLCVGFERCSVCTWVDGEGRTHCVGRNWYGAVYGFMCMCWVGVGFGWGWGVGVVRWRLGG